MMLRRLAIFAAVILLSGIPAQAVTFTSIQDTVDTVSADSTLMSGWLNDQVRNGAAFNSTAGNVVPTQLKLFNFEVGVEAVGTASVVDMDSFHNLGTQVIDTQQYSLPDRLPFPGVLGHAKIGLPFGLDVGVRLGGIPSKTFEDGSTHFEISNTVAGIDLRHALIKEGMAKPFGLTLGLNYTHAKGHVTMSSPYTAEAGNVVDLGGGNTYTPSLSATGTERSDWKTDSIGVQAVMNKKIFFINPYLGASANRNYGTVESSVNNIGELVLTPIGASTPVANQTLAAGGGVSSKPHEWDVRALAGIEISILPFTKLGIHGEYGDMGRFGGALGLRVQFP